MRERDNIHQIRPDLPQTCPTGVVQYTYTYCQWCESDSHLDDTICPETTTGHHGVIVHSEQCLEQPTSPRPTPRGSVMAVTAAIVTTGVYLLRYGWPW